DLYMVINKISFFDLITSKENVPIKIHVFAVLTLLIIIVGMFARVFFLGETLVDLAAHSNQLPWGANTTEYSSYAYNRRDLTDTYITRDYFLVDGYRSKELPLWNPYILAGHPIYADGVTKIFAPINLLYLIFDIPLGYSLARLLELALATIFIYLFLINLSLNPAAAFTGSLVFLLSDNVMQHLTWLGWLGGLMWLPLMLLGADKALAERKILPAIGSGIALALQFYSGYTPTAIYYLGALISYYLLVSLLNKTIINKLTAIKTSLKYLSITLLVGFGLSAANWWPVFELLSFSNRKIVPTEIGYVWLPPWHLLTLILPRAFGRAFDHNISSRFVDIGVSQDHIIYLGLITLILIAFIFWRSGWKLADTRIYYFLFLTLGALLVMTCTPVYVHITKYIPVLKTIRAVTRISGLYCFGATVLAAYGADLLLKASWTELKTYLQQVKNFMLFLLGSLIIAMLAFNIVAIPNNFSEISGVKRLLLRILVSLQEYFYWRNSDFIISLIIIVILTILLWILVNSAKDQKIKFAVTALLILFLELTWQSNQYNPTYKSVIYPKTNATEFLKNNVGFNRVVVAPAELRGKTEKIIGDKIVAPPNTLLPYKINTIYGKDQLFPKWYREFTNLSERQDRLSHIVFNQISSPMYGFLGAKYLLTENNVEVDNVNYKKVYEGEGVKIFENLLVKPRAFFATNFQQVDRQDQVIHKLKEQTLDNLSNIIISDKNVNLDNIKTASNTDKVEITSYKNNQVVLKTISDGTKLLVLTDTYYPGWEVLIDDKPAKLIRANHAFRAVVITEGQHKVEFIFRPKSFYYGAVISLISLILTSIAIFWCRKI
ncbi:MAG: YfhO family protein, partial [Blastocatellia bacterium]